MAETLHDTDTYNPEFVEYEANLPSHLQRANRPRLEIGYRLTVHDIRELSKAVFDELAEAVMRRTDKEALKEIDSWTSDRRDPPDIGELLARAARQIVACKTAEQHLSETTAKLIALMAEGDEMERV